MLTPPLFYWLCMALLAVVWMLMRNLLASQWGRAFEALRDSPIATDAMGVGTYQHKVAAFALGSGLGGLAGGLYAFNFQYLQPQSFTYDLMIILLRGATLPSGSLFRVSKSGVARTFQNLQLFGELTALENVMVALRSVYRSPLPLVLLGLARLEERQAQADALCLLDRIGLKDQALTKAKDLTYGAQRFLEVARALARKPDLLILDEPAAGLAHPDVVQLIEIIKRVHKRGISILLIEHHMDVVSELCDIVTVLDGGKVIAEGTPEEVKRHPRVVEAYLGQPVQTDIPGGAEPLPA